MKTLKADFKQLCADRITSTTYLTHGIHKYTARIIPQIPHHFIGKCTKENHTILDSFCGSGTTLLEARLLNRNAIGIDINPLAELISRVKTKPLDTDELSLAICLVKEYVKNATKKATVEFPNIDYWFCKKAQKELVRIKVSIEDLKGKFDNDIIDFFLVCFSSVIRKSSYADCRMAKTYKSQRVFKKVKKGWVPKPIQFFEESLDKNSERIKLLSERLNENRNFVKVFQGDAKETSTILKQNGIKKVNFIVTSPPYINAQDYFRSYKLEIWWLGLATPEEVRHLNRQAIGTECISGFDYNNIPESKIKSLDRVLRRIWRSNKKTGKKEKIAKKKGYIIYNYFENMKCVLKEFYDVLERAGHLCLISGNNTICGIQIPTYKILTDIAENSGFELVEISRDRIRNRSLPPKRNHRGGIIKEEWITVFRKGE